MKHHSSKVRWSFLLLLLFGLTNQLAYSADLNAGKLKANMACSLCHGANSIAKIPNAPSLAGQNAQYLQEQLKAFRSKSRQNEVMSVIAAPLTDQEIENISLWYSAMKVEVTLPN